MDTGFKILFLGTGTSTGVPMIGCDCPVCKSANPRNRRGRSSIYVSAGDVRILVDTPPDFREQALRHDIRRVDAVLVTHAHFDHLFGLDDVRRLNTIEGDRTIPLFSNPDSLDTISTIYAYVFKPRTPGTYRPKIDLRPVEGPFSVEDLFTGKTSPIKITPFNVVHGKSGTTGFRFDFNGRSLAYAPDVHDLANPDEPILRDLDVMVIDCLRFREHPTHLTVDRALEIVRRFNPGRAYLTHICHDLDHDEFCRYLDAQGLPNVRPAYDTLEIEP